MKTFWISQLLLVKIIPAWECWVCGHCPEDQSTHWSWGPRPQLCPWSSGGASAGAWQLLGGRSVHAHWLCAHVHMQTRASIPVFVFPGQRVRNPQHELLCYYWWLFPSCESRRLGSLLTAWLLSAVPREVSPPGHLPDSSTSSLARSHCSCPQARTHSSCLHTDFPPKGLKYILLVLPFLSVPRGWAGRCSLEPAPPPPPGWAWEKRPSTFQSGRLLWSRPAQPSVAAGGLQVRNVPISQSSRVTFPRLHCAGFKFECLVFFPQELSCPLTMNSF